MKRQTRSTGLRGKLAVTCLAALGAACGPQEQPDEAANDSLGAAGEMQGGMEGMPGMQGAMMESMRTHLERMGALPADSIEAVLATHRQLVGNLLAQMNREMREMQMTTNAAWDATVDSLRSDLTRMRRMGEAELEALMQGHRARVLRLMTMHAEMMCGM